MSTPENPYSDGVPHDAPGQPIDWNKHTLTEFVDQNYWHEAEHAIGDIRLFITLQREKARLSHPYPWQQAIIDEIYGHTPRSGKSWLINYLAEFDRNSSKT